MPGIDIDLNIENGEGSGSIQQNESTFTEESIIFSDGTKGTQNGDVVPGAEAKGIGAVAFGGLRYDYYTSPEILAHNRTIEPTAEEHWGRTPTSAEGNQSFAVGGSSHAYGDWAVAMGKDVTSSATAALAVNEGTQALHPHSLAAGFYTKTGAQYQAVFGKYNEGKSNTVFEVGYGSSSTRKNVFEVMTDGRAKVYGKPVEDNDVVRKKDISTTIDQDFFNSLY